MIARKSSGCPILPLTIFPPFEVVILPECIFLCNSNKDRREPGTELSLLPWSPSASQSLSIMTFYPSPAVAIVLAVVLVLVSACSWRPALRDIPGPFLARWTDLWYMWHIYQGRFEHKNLELHEKHGETPSLSFFVAAILFSKLV